MLGWSLCWNGKNPTDSTTLFAERTKMKLGHIWSRAIIATTLALLPKLNVPYLNNMCRVATLWTIAIKLARLERATQSGRRSYSQWIRELLSGRQESLFVSKTTFFPGLHRARPSENFSFQNITKKNAANLDLILRARRVIFILLVAVCDNEILWKLILWNIYEPCNITTTTHDKAKKKSSLMIINDYIMRQKCLFFLSALKGVPTLSCRRDVSIEQWIERMPHEENPLSAYNVNKT